MVIVPKSRKLGANVRRLIGSDYVLGYSVPSSYGHTTLRPSHFEGPVHLLGGRPDLQRALADEMNVISLDCNRFTLDAKYGKAFDGERFRKIGAIGYDACIFFSMKGINQLWAGYGGGIDAKCSSTRRARIKLHAKMAMILESSTCDLAKR